MNVFYPEEDPEVLQEIIDEKDAALDEAKRTIASLNSEVIRLKGERQTFGDKKLIGFSFDALEDVAKMLEKSNGMRLRKVIADENPDGSYYVHVEFESIKGEGNDTE